MNQIPNGSNCNGCPCLEWINGGGIGPICKLGMGHIEEKKVMNWKEVRKSEKCVNERPAIISIISRREDE